MYSAPNHVPNVLQWIEIGTHCRPGKFSDCNFFKKSCHKSRTVGSSVVVHEHRASGRLVVVKMRNKNRLQNVPDVTIAIEIALHS